jgi:hypothetical protein
MALTQSNVWDYFETISPLAQHMVEEAKKVIAKEDNRWEQMSQEERERAIDCHFIDPTISAQYETLGTLGNEDTALEMIFPRLKFQSGRETVRFKDGDREETITYHDEFSGQFCWESKSQQELKLDELCTPGVVQTTPPPQHNKGGNKAGQKHYRKHSAHGKNDLKGTEVTLTVDTKQQVAEPNPKQASVNSARPYLDESIPKPDHETSVSASSTEPFSQGSLESEKLVLLSSQTRLSPGSNVDVGTEPKTQNSFTGRLTSAIHSASASASTSTSTSTSENSHPISGLTVATSSGVYKQPVVTTTNEASIRSRKEDSDSHHDRAKSDISFRLSQHSAKFDFLNNW